MSVMNDLENDFKNSVQIDKGGVIEIKTEDERGFDDTQYEESVQMYSNPCSTTFEVLRSGMEKLSDYVYKKTTKPGQGAMKININRCRITYHYNIYLENHVRPSDSTHLRGFPEILCLSLEQEAVMGIQQAIASMVNKEEALFCISHTYAVGTLEGRPNRYPPNTDILVHITIMKVELVDQVTHNLTKNKITSHKCPMNGHKKIKKRELNFVKHKQLIKKSLLEK
ncbi:unnamed protein product [Diamesa hyperborea]